MLQAHIVAQRFRMVSKKVDALCRWEKWRSLQAHDSCGYLIIVILVRVPLWRQLRNVCCEFCGHVIHIDELLGGSWPPVSTPADMLMIVSLLSNALFAHAHVYCMGPC